MPRKTKCVCPGSRAERATPSPIDFKARVAAIFRDRNKTLEPLLCRYAEWQGDPSNSRRAEAAAHAAGCDLIMDRHGNLRLAFEE